jgi:hypothetical protein
LAVRPKFIANAARSIILARSSTRQQPLEPTIGKFWVTRFLKRHGYNKYRQKTIDADRQAAEELEIVQKYFKQLREVLDNEGIQPTNLWNMDETGFRIGVGKNQFIITKRRRQHYLGVSENRESATAIEAISANGDYIPAFLILSDQMHQAQWYNHVHFICMPPMFCTPFQRRNIHLKDAFLNENTIN